jgi:hypothetical protein
VACAEEFHSVSKARVWSISMAALRNRGLRRRGLRRHLLCRLRLRALRHRLLKNGGSGQHQSEQQNAA